VGATTPAGGFAALKPATRSSPDVGDERVQKQAHRLLRAARDAAGLAAYHYFFLDATADARAAYLAAIEAEAEAELFLRDVGETPPA